MLVLLFLTPKLLPASIQRSRQRSRQSSRKIMAFANTTVPVVKLEPVEKGKPVMKKEPVGEKERKNRTDAVISTDPFSKTAIVYNRQWLLLSRSPWLQGLSGIGGQWSRGAPTARYATTGARPPTAGRANT